MKTQVTDTVETLFGRNGRWLWLLPVALAVLAMLPAGTGELVWDDVFWNRQIAWFKSFADVLQPPAGIPDWPAGYFRPVTTLSYLLDRQLWGDDWVMGRHVSNIGFHALATLLLWLLARRVLHGTRARETGALATAALFAVHPIHTESVGWIGARVDVLATVFVIASLVLALAWRDRRSIAGLVLAPLAFFLALGSKEVGIAGLALLPLALLIVPARDAETPARLAVTWLPLLASFAVAVALWWWLRAAGTASVAEQFGGVDPLKLLRATGYYLGKLAWPWPQLNFAGWHNVPGALASAGIAGVSIALATAAFLSWRRQRAGAALFGLLWIGVALAPSLVVALSSFATNPVAERYLYLPSAGFALAAGALVAATGPGRTGGFIRAVAAALVAVLFVACFQRSLDWSSNVRLWATATRQGPVQAQPWVELATAQYRAGDYAAALASFATARTLEIDPGTLGIAEYNAGLIHLKLGEWRDAEAAFNRARAADPTLALARHGLGRVYYEEALATAAPAARLALVDRAQVAFLGAIGLDATFGEPRLELAKVLLRRGDTLVALGNSGRAEKSYRGARAQLELLLGAIPTLTAEPGIAALADEIRRKAP